MRGSTWTLCALGVSLGTLLSRQLACDSTGTGGAPPAPGPGEVTISEVMDRPHAGRPEWVELRSRALQARSLDGCALSDGGDSAHVVFLGGPLTVDPGGRVVVAEAALDPAGAVATDEVLGDGALVLDEDDPGEILALYCPDGAGGMVLVDEVALGELGGGEQGHSWMAVSAGTGVDWCLADAAQAYRAEDGRADCGTPGEANGCGPGVATPTDPGQIRVTEIMVAPDAGREWFELVNVAGHELDLAGCTLGEGGDGTVHEHEVTGDRGVTVVAPGEMLVLAATGLDLVDSAGPQADYAYGGLTFNNGDAEDLWIACAGVEIERVSYDWAAVDGERGQALSRDPDHPESWCLATWPFYQGDDGAAWGTPGEPNPSCGEPEEAEPRPSTGEIVITEIMIAPSHGSLFPEWVEVTNVGPREVTLAGCRVEDDGHEGVLDGGPILAPGGMAILAQEEADPSCGLRVLATYGGAVTFNNGSEDRAALACPDPDGGWVTVDEVWFDWEGLDLDKGRAWGLDSGAVDAAANDDPSRWCGAPDGAWSCTLDGHTDTGTPGSLATCP